MANSNVIEDRVYQASALTQVPRDKPYLIHNLGRTVPQLSLTEPGAKSTPLDVYVHDIPGDYSQIDSLLDLIRDKLITYPPLVPEARLIQCLWLGNSRDIPEDPKTGTISKIGYFRVVHK